MSDFLGFFLPLGLIVVFVISGCVALSDVTGRYQCRNYEIVTGKPTRWVLLDNCYIQTDKGWQHWEEYKLRAAASEGLLGAKQ